MPRFIKILHETYHLHRVNETIERVNLTKQILVFGEYKIGNIASKFYVQLWQ